MSQHVSKVMDYGRSYIKNPLGILGLFLLLIYLIASLVAGFGNIDKVAQTTLIRFIVIFPFCVLGVFYRLVTSHHVKLYSPNDFRDESLFLKVIQSTEGATKKFENENSSEGGIKSIDHKPINQKETRMSRIISFVRKFRK